MVSQRDLDLDRPTVGLTVWSSVREARIGLGADIAGSETFGCSLCPMVLHGASNLVRTSKGLEAYNREVESDSGLG